MGFEALARILEVCYKSGVKYVTIYAFSIENFKRSRYEVDGLMDMAKTKLVQMSQHGELLQRYGAAVKILGNRSLVREDVPGAGGPGGGDDEAQRARRAERLLSLYGTGRNHAFHPGDGAGVQHSARTAAGKETVQRDAHSAQYPQSAASLHPRRGAGAAAADPFPSKRR